MEVFFNSSIQLLPNCVSQVYHPFYLMFDITSGTSIFHELVSKDTEILVPSMDLIENIHDIYIHDKFIVLWAMNRRSKIYTIYICDTKSAQKIVT